MAQQQQKKEFALPLDYIDVATRVVDFREKHPTGSLQQIDIQFLEFANTNWVVYTAAAYRTPDDERPGIGTAWEPVPGRTPFTRDSELQNAETAAWGRAIVAALAADTKYGIASSEEIRNREAEKQEAQPKQAPAKPAAPKKPTLAQVKARAMQLMPGKTWEEIGDLAARWAEVATAKQVTLPLLTGFVEEIIRAKAEQQQARASAGTGAAEASDKKPSDGKTAAAQPEGEKK